MVDIDEQLVSMCRMHLQPMHRGSFDSPKLQVVIGDGADFLGHAEAGSFDAIVVDGIDFGRAASAGPRATYGNVLFSRLFYERAHRALRSGGAMGQYMSDALSE